LYGHADEYQQLFRRIFGYAPEVLSDFPVTGAGVVHINVGQLDNTSVEEKAAGVGAGITRPREALTGEHAQQLQQISQAVATQDAILVEIGDALDGLQHAANNIHDVRGAYLQLHRTHPHILYGKGLIYNLAGVKAAEQDDGRIGQQNGCCTGKARQGQ
jgi:hypothetical protein